MPISVLLKHSHGCRGKSHDPTIVLQAVASEDLQIWNCFCLPGFLNDINVLHRYHLLAYLASDDATACDHLQ
jgi:hypothetical protein